MKTEEMEAVKKELTGICLFVTSTFGNGDPPRTGEALAEWIDLQLTKQETLQHNRMARSSNVGTAVEGLDQSEHISVPSKSLNRRRGMAETQILGDLRLIFGAQCFVCKCLSFNITHTFEKVIFIRISFSLGMVYLH